MATDLATITIQGLPGGMNLAVPANMIPDGQARYLQDILVDKPGVIRRRGPLTELAGAVSFAGRKILAIGQADDPQGNIRYIVPNRSTGGTSYISIVSSDFTSKIDLDLDAVGAGIPFSTGPYTIFDIKPMLKDGAIVGISNAYTNNATTQSVLLYRGGFSPHYNTGTITATRGSRTVTGSGTAWLANVTPGMFLIGSSDVSPTTVVTIGVVKSVEANNSLTLEDVSPHPVTARVYTTYLVKPFVRSIATGRITTQTANATVTGSGTKFVDERISTGIWEIFRSSDNAFVGKVTSVASNTSLTFAANSALALTDERYIALRLDDDFGTANPNKVNSVGFLNANYSSRQFFANQARVVGAEDYSQRIWFSNAYNVESVDLSSEDGNFIPLMNTSNMNTPITGIFPTANALLIFKEDETHGLFGSTPGSFVVKRMQADGAINGMSVVAYKRGAIWAGREGIYFYDGIDIVNVVEDTLGDYYKSLMRSFNSTNFRMYAMLERNHYILFIENATPPIGIVKGSTGSIPTKLTIVVNMDTRAVSLFTNVNIRGGFRPNSSTGKPTVAIVNTVTDGKIVDVSQLFNGVGTDTIVCDSGTAGPDFYLETKRYDMSTPLLKKKFKLLLFHYTLSGSGIFIDPVPGISDIGATPLLITSSGATWTSVSGVYLTWDSLAAANATWGILSGSGIFTVGKKKFLRRNQHLGLRFYQQNSSVTDLQLGGLQVGYKPGRQGAI